MSARAIAHCDASTLRFTMDERIVANLHAKTLPPTAAEMAVGSAERALSVPRLRIGPYALVLPGLLLILALFVGPLLYMAYLSVTEPSWGLQNYAHMASEPVYLRVIGYTIQTAVFVTVLALLLGYPVAYLLSSLPERWANLLLVAVVLPYFVSFLIRTYAWMMILGRKGVVNEFLVDTGLVEQPLKLLFTTFSVYVGMVHVMTPIMILVLYGVMRGIDRNLIQAARSLGATPFQAFARVFLPLSMTGVGSAVLLVFILSLGFYITPALLGSGREVMIAGVIENQISRLRNWGFGAALSVVLLTLVALTYLVLRPVARFDQAVTGSLGGGPSGDRSPPAASGLRRVYALLGRLARVLLTPVLLGLERLDVSVIARSRWAAAIGKTVGGVFVGAVLVFVLAPVLIVVPLSFSAANFLEFPPGELSLRWYEQFLTDASWRRATLFSVRVGVTSALLALLLGLAATVALVRFRPRAGRFLYLLFLVPIVVPEIVPAVGIYIIYIPFKLANTMLGFVLAHATLAIPVVVVVVAPALDGLDVRFEQAARSLGASPLRTFWRITVPLIRPSIIAAALLAFLTSFDNLIMALFLAGSATETLPLKMWNEIRLEITPIIAAISSLEVALVAISLFVLAQMRNRRGTTKAAVLPA